MVTCLLGELVPLLDHVQQVAEVLVGRGEALDMVPHTDHQNGTAVDVPATEPVLSRLVDLLDDRLISRDLVRPVVLVPLDPLAPLLDGLLPVEFSSDREPRDRVDVGV